MIAREVGPGKYLLDFVPNPDNLDRVKNRSGERFPGTSYLRERKKWVTNRVRVRELGCMSSPLKSASVPFPETFEPHQQRAWKRLLEEKSMILSWVTGAGKSYFAVQAVKLLGQKSLVVAPKMVLQNLQKEFRAQGIEPRIVGSTLKAEREADSKVTLVGYASLHKVEPDDWNMVIADELHYAMNQKSNRTKKLREIVDELPPSAYVLGLTATPFGAKAITIWSQLDCIIPGGFGTRVQWENYFHNIGEKEIPNREDPVRDVGSLREDRHEEYCDYLYQFLDYVGEDQFADLLPDSEWKLKWLDGNYRVAPKDLGGWARTQEKLAAERVAQLPQPNGPTAYICYLNSTSELVGKALGCPVITGKVSTKKRMEILETTDCFVAGLKAITEGLNLSRFTNVYVVEGYPVVRYMSQVLGRFLRLKATEKITYTFLPMKGTADEVIYPRLLERLVEKNRILKSGSVESGLMDLLTVDENDESLLTDLQEILMAGDWVDVETY